jgi:hypothetical protein
MNPVHQHWGGAILGSVACLTCRLSVVAADEPTVANNQTTQFLRNTKLVHCQNANKGVPNDEPLTLSGITITRAASFQASDEPAVRQLAGFGP